MNDENIETIWQVVAQIPKGKVVSYGQVATLAGIPKHARFVGRVLKELPNGTNLPWHRVLRSDGCIAFPVGSEKFKQQKHRLVEEGIVFETKIPMRIYQWQP